MSHTLNIKTEIKDTAALRAACARLGYQVHEGEARLFQGIESGLSVMLPGWNYPVVVKEDGTIRYDNYGGRWGNIEELNKLTAYYGLEKAKIEAWKQGYSVVEGFNENTQELTLTVNVGW